MGITLSRANAGAAACALTLAWASGLGAAGFALQEHGVRGLGNAYAGAPAAAHDESTVFFNPAGMTRLTGSGALVAGHVVVPSAKFSDRGSTLTAALPAALGGGAPLAGSDGGDLGVGALVPGLYVVGDLTPAVTVGLGVNAPFGLKTDFEEGWAGRYHAQTSSVLTLNVNPSVALRIGDRLSVGAGASAQYFDGRLTNALDKSTLCIGAATAALGGGAVPAVCGPLGLLTPGNPASDGRVDVRVDDWSFGVNLGLLWEPSPGTRVGAHWRSRVEHRLEGRARFQGTTDLAALSTAVGLPGAFTDQGVTADLTLPESLSVGVHHALSARLAVLADVTWTRWSRFESLVLRFDGGHPDNVTPAGWDDTLRYALGLAFEHTPGLTLRAGIALDETPIPSAAARTPRIPDDDRLWVALGASYERDEHLSVDVGYAHLFVGDVPIDNLEVNTGHRLRGEFDAEIDVVGVQLRYRFD